MDLNHVLIIVIGIFVAGFSVLWMVELKKAGADKTKKIIAWALIVAGVLIALFPLITDRDPGNLPGTNVGSKASSSASGQDGVKEIVIGDDFIKEKIKSDTSYAHFVARQWYSEAVQKWNDKTYRYDSVDLAIEQLKKSIDFFEMAMAHEALGQALVQKGQIKKGIAAYTRAIEMDPKLGAAYFNRGTAYYILNEPENYCPDWIKALELGVPNAVDATRTYCGL